MCNLRGLLFWFSCGGEGGGWSSAGGEDEQDDSGKCDGQVVEGESGVGRAEFGGSEVLIVADVVDGKEGEGEVLRELNAANDGEGEVVVEKRHEASDVEEEEDDDDEGEACGRDLGDGEGWGGGDGDGDGSDGIHGLDGHGEAEEEASGDVVERSEDDTGGEDEEDDGGECDSEAI
ncbi:major centromere autoantigen B-like [Cajanus cajan]|uniref:major centromere autoantigen B-like n=1 Tax=Cajanus cajan TaxID=3821 RepID=UPI00098D8BBB|nr:major centromere autoantigen B-like [Cajanus cajan]XP_020232187.1 major centromere autoantigen B-like [Cajanus cajan]